MQCAAIAASKLPDEKVLAIPVEIGHHDLGRAGCARSVDRSHRLAGHELANAPVLIGPMLDSSTTGLSTCILVRSRAMTKSVATDMLAATVCPTPTLREMTAVDTVRNDGGAVFEVTLPANSEPM